jgi:hypothetical protein
MRIFYSRFGLMAAKINRRKMHVVLVPDRSRTYLHIVHEIVSFDNGDGWTDSMKAGSVLK